MRRLLDLHYAPFDWPDEVPVLDHGRNEDRWAVVIDGERAKMEAAMAMLRKVCNRSYRLPRPMRFRSPGMYVVGVCESWDEALASWVERSSTSTWMGGEVFHYIAVCPSTRQMACPQQYGTVGKMRQAMYRPDELAARLMG